jgi:hypothetical protein
MNLKGAANSEPTAAPTDSPTFYPTTEPTFDVDNDCGACIEIYEGDSVFPHRRIEPITTEKDIEEFYCYDCHDYSFNGDDVLTLVPDYSLVFVHQNERSCDLSLVVIHDSKEEYSGGKVVMHISGNLENSVVQDGRDSPSDSYEYSRRNDETKCSWVWSWQSGKKYRTDGIAGTSGKCVFSLWNPVC